jgi:hypothetical protein
MTMAIYFQRLTIHKLPPREVIVMAVLCRGDNIQRRENTI